MKYIIGAGISGLICGYYNKDYVNIRIPFDRYYMNEYKAIKAEKEYQKHSRVSKNPAYITVRVIHGSSTLEELYINDQPINEFLASSTDK